MGKQTNCVCGKSVNRTKEIFYHNAKGARGSGRIKPVFTSPTQLCSDCMTEFIINRPSHEPPAEPGTHKLCDWCNGECDQNIIEQLTIPSITRWKGKVPNSKGNSKTVCAECRDELEQFIYEKQNES